LREEKVEQEGHPFHANPFLLDCLVVEVQFKLDWGFAANAQNRLDLKRICNNIYPCYTYLIPSLYNYYLLMTLLLNYLSVELVME
jgi:hypothetical protein